MADKKEKQQSRMRKKEEEREKLKHTKIGGSREENAGYMNQILPVQESFDLVKRDLLIGGRMATFYFIDGFTKDEVMLKVYEGCIAIDCRTYPARGVDEPAKDKSLRGSRDGFVETIVFNTALMRRRIRDPHLVMEMKEVGDSSRTDVAVCYMSDRVDRELLLNVKRRIAEIRADDLRMNQQSLAECLFRRKWYNPFPKFKYTERPDTAAACLLEGKIVILVDNSPSAMILPTSIFDVIEEANDYYFPTLTNLYLKTARGLITLLMLEIAIDGLRLAAMSTPTMLSTPLSVIAGLVMGEFSVQSGWFNSEVMLYMAFVAVANYTQPNFELGYALKFMRLELLILTALLNWIGFAAGFVIVVLSICFNKTLSGRNYLNVKLN